MLIQLQDIKEQDLTEYTVIVPSVCIGNAAQLACDLLISSMNLKRIGSISHPALIPIYGPSAYQHDSHKSSACELYSCSTSRIVVFQFRSPFISRHMSSFHKELSQFVGKISSRVIILSGSLGFEKRIIDACPYEYKASDIFKEQHADNLKNMKWNEFKGETIFGGGNGLQLYEALVEMKVPTMILFRYLLEGDNSTDARFILKELAELCDGFLSLKADNGGMQLKVPISWKLLFGNDIPELIF